MTQEQNEEILDILEEKPIEEDNEDYTKALRILTRRVKKLKCYGKECECEDDTIIAHLINEPQMHDYELIHICLKCGGYIEW